MNTNEIIIYQPDNTFTQFEVRIEDDTVWLTQPQIALLFGTKRPAISKHLINIYKTGELLEQSTCSILEHMGKSGIQKYKTQYYNLDAILSIGYRVNSINATQFRIWANKVLKEYLLKGYAIHQRFEKIEKKLFEHDQTFDLILKTSLPPNQGIFYEGQIFDAYKFASDLIKSAKKSIILIDNYIDESVLTILSKRHNDVLATIYTNSISKQFQLDLERFKAQYPKIEVKTFSKSHDRFLIIDQTTVYHFGASLKDLGKKWFAFSKMELSANEIVQRLQ